jgi:serine/threonine-protein kinase
MNRCPAPEQLRRLLDGPEAEKFAAHLEGCRACQQALEALTAGGPRPGPTPAEAVAVPPTVREREDSLRQLGEAFPPFVSPPSVADPFRGDRADGEPGPSSPDGGPAADPPQAAPASAGRYQLEGRLGQGGMGEVFRARDPQLRRSLAVKVLRDHPGGGAGLAARFLEEAQVTGQLQHPGIPPVHEVGRLEDGRPFFAMKLIQGTTLAELLARRPAPGADLPRFLTVFEQVCQAVGYAHSRGVIHRDLKPGNVMVGAFGEVQVLDWGLAKVLPRGGGEGPARGGLPPEAAHADPIVTVRTEATGLSSRDGAVLGTLAYMAPEQARGEAEGVDERTDVFGLGAILCEALTGQPPYRGELAEVFGRAQAGDLAEAFARLEASGADAELVRLARACLAPEKGGRPADGGAVAAAVAAYQAGVQERLRAAERQRAAAEVRAREERKRRRVQRALASAVVLLLLGGGAFAWWADRQATDRRTERAVAETRARLVAEQALADAEDGLRRDLPAKADTALQM